MTDDRTPKAAPPDLVGELVAVTRRLIEVISAETAVLESRSTPDLSAFVPEKSKLSVRYDVLMKEVARVPSAALHASADFAALREAVDRLAVLAAANARAIELHIKATKRVLSIIARAARQATQPTFTYGGERIGYGTRSPANSAVAVNRVS